MAVQTRAERLRKEKKLTVHGGQLWLDGEDVMGGEGLDDGVKSTIEVGGGRAGSGGVSGEQVDGRGVGRQALTDVDKDEGAVGRWLLEAKLWRTKS